ncbi:GNAT family N-acetyltransferase [Massilia violaceinigra]|uniref:GNAT family N-acetyltransferase n=1 Tax=Massilia violaceinigra TaxID=2045208 RepID=A0A2D2DN13_9BURK|nr:GNAT family N-acetyltransferase [Massilia violaceinigra]ATQ76367.1 GNAT family N-acetyltransferase [Massilia violaceinigra]
MSNFSKTIESFWQESFLAGDILYRSDTLIVAANPDMEAGRQLMLLETTDGKAMVVLTPALADKLGLYHQQDLTEAMLRQKLQDTNVRLHGADYVFHFTEAERQALLQEPLPDDLRQLSATDDAMFAEFQSNASEQDLDNAYVELDHWVVFGSFEQDRLVCAASMYPWDDQKIADVGVLTLPPFRSKGHARRVIRAISRHAYAQGYEPQYRCQLDNAASVALAKGAGLTLFGKWDAVLSESAE